MKRYTFKRLKYYIWLLGCIALLLSGCGNEKKPAVSDTEAKLSKPGTNSSNLTREEYIALVGQYFGYDNYETTDDFFSDVSDNNLYYDYIQACAEWEVIPAGDGFQPKDEATLEFALATAVRAIGVNELQGIEDDSDDQTLADFYVNNIAQLDKTGYTGGITKSIARQVLQYALTYESELEFPQYVDVEYAPAVREADEKIIIPISGNTGILQEEHDYQVGDIVYFAQTPMGYPRGVRITSISGDQFTFEDVTVDEVFSRLELSGTFDGEITNVFSASDDVGVYQEEIYYPSDMSHMNEKYHLSPLANGVKVDKGKDHVTFVASVSEGKNKAEFRFGISNIKTTIAYKHGVTVLNPEDVKLNVTFDTVMEASAEFHSSKSIPLGSIDINVWGPMFVNMSLTANIGADGEMKLDYTIHNTANAEWKKNKGVSRSFTSTTSSSFEGNITLTAEMTAMADLIVKFFGDHSIINAQLTSGIVVVAKLDVDLLGNQPTCIDVFGYVPLRWGINQKGCLVTAINNKWKTQGVIWDSKTSEFTFHRHLEDYVRTPDDQCTRGFGEEVIQEAEKTDGSPLNEYEIFDFEPISFDFIRVKDYAAFLDIEGKTDIEFTDLPEGYTGADLVYTAEDTSVCSVQDGTIIGLKSGTTLLKIATQDGMFSVTIAVIVNNDYSIEGGFEEL